MCCAPDAHVGLVLTGIRVLKQVVPPEDADEDDADPAPVNAPSKRPAFSLPVMTNNFRRFNAR